ncbi:peroxisome assembly factor [Thraustotheca clavata]|uniref:Peroxisomal ATPase PEX6 n=1 Tax=Thraustotheca clavata TaxID=74557 RepID=A0A1W0AAT2_9STRA|nr:peroxisome assembly factor [Thraustotheca clavata]
MAALWVSSFTKLHGASSPTRSTQLKLRVVYELPEVPDTLHEVTAIVFVSLPTLRRLGIISEAFVVVANAGKERVARACFGPHVPDNAVFLSPFLEFNIGLHKTTGMVDVRPATNADIGVPLNASIKAITMPPAAKRVEISPLLVLTSTPDVLHQELLLQTIRQYFSTPRLLRQGDVFGIIVYDVYPSEQVTAGVVDVPAEVFHGDDHGEISNVSIVIPNPLQIPIDIVFFSVQVVEAPVSSLVYTITCEDTTLIQTKPITLRIPTEARMRKFLTDRCTKAHTMTNQLTATTQSLVELLHPTSLSIPMSILLSGPAGIGKKSMIYDAAASLGLYVVEVCFTELTSSSELQMLENIRQIVAKAEQLSPCVLFINRFFAIDKDNEEAALRIGATLVECLDIMDRSSVPLIATVEDANELPATIRQCFLYELAIEAPSEAERLEMLRVLTASSALDLDVDLNDLAHRTAGRTFGELRALIADASSFRLAAMDELTTIEDDVLVDSLTTLSIRMEDIERALKEQETKSSLGLGNASIPNIKWEDVGGLDHVKDEILDMVQLPLKHPELFASGVRQRSGILLYGPPGTGKTLLAKAIATECNMNFISVKGPELLNMYIGESEKNVRHVFQMARNARPCILFFDELDSLAPMRGRGSDSGGVMDRVVSQLLTEIDSNLNQVFVIGATNRPDLIESALLRPGRFDRLLYLGICSDKAAQLKVVQALTRKFSLAPSINLEKILASCPLHFTGADFYALCSIALANAIKDRVLQLDAYIQSTNLEDCYSARPLTPAMVLDKMTPQELQVQVTTKHFEHALASIVPSVSPSELAHYEKLRKQFSSLDAAK